MMDIIVFIKEVVDPNKGLDTTNWHPASRPKDDIIMNPYDKHAIEAALQLKETHGGVVKAVSFGSANAEKILREAFAMGCDEIYRVDNSELKIVDPYLTATVLAKTVEKMGIPDLILFGMQSSDFATAMVPVLVARKLKIPHLSFIEKIDVNDGILTVERYIEGGKRKSRTSKPAVLSITSTANEPRYTSIRRIMKAKKAPLEVYSVEDLGLSKEDLSLASSPISVIEIKPPEKIEKKLVRFEDEDIEAMVDKLLQKLKEDGINLEAYKK